MVLQYECMSGPQEDIKLEKTKNKIKSGCGVVWRARVESAGFANGLLGKHIFVRKRGHSLNNGGVKNRTYKKQNKNWKKGH